MKIHHKLTPEALPFNVTTQLKPTPFHFRKILVGGVPACSSPNIQLI